MVMRNSETIIVNGTESYFENQGNDAVWVDFPSSDLPSTVTSIAVAADVATTPSIYAIEVNGRLLIDGPADNSQVWSEFVDTQDFTIEPNRGPDKGFDGDLTTSCAVNAMGSRYSIYLKDLSFANEEVRVYTSNGSNSTSRFFKLNGATTGLAANLPSQWITLGNAAADGTATIEVGSTDEFQRTIFYAIEIGGKLLIDGCARWNTSQIWSANSTGSWSSAPVSQGFDGNLVTEAAPEDGISNELVVSFDEITAQKIEVYRPLAFFSDVDGSYVVEGADGTQTYTIPGEEPEGWTTVYEGSEIRIDTIKAIRNSAGTGGEYRAWRFDGELLVDGGSFGANGFHLPFNPAATGKDYTTTSTFTGAWNGTDFDEIFDGNFSTGCSVGGQNTGNSVNNPCVVTLGESISNVTSVKVVMGYDGGQTAGVNTETRVSVGSSDPFEIYSGPAITLSSLSFTSSNPAGSNLSAIIVNNKTLIDHSAIGVDASGQGNNFQDENFAVGNTDEVWSANATGDWYVGYEPRKAFNGFVSGTDQAATQAGSEVTFNNLTINSSLRIYTFSNIADKLKAVLGGNTVNVTFGSEYEWRTVDLPSTPISFDKLIWETEHPGVAAIEVDGKLLIDANIQDTVTDTPMRNYAVGKSGENGNLVCADSGTVATVPISSGKYYFEVTAGANTPDGSNVFQAGIFNSPTWAGSSGFMLESSGFLYAPGSANLTSGYTPVADSSGDIIGVAYDKDDESLTFFVNGEQIQKDGSAVTVNTSEYAGQNTYAQFTGYGSVPATANFGQQPFAASNVTHDWDAGTVEIDGETYSTLYQPLGSTTATLTIADAGTLGSIEGTPTMTAKFGGATGTYASHTDTELVLSNTRGAWSVASETAISDTEHTIAAIDPNDFVMTSSEFSATPLEATHGSSTWQVTEVADTTYASPVINVTSEGALTTYNAGGLEGDTTYRARVKHTSSNNVESLWSEEVHQNIFKTEPTLLDTPDATMYGLRFDSPRKTVLTRTPTTASNRKTWTWSGWVKLTGTDEFNYLFDAVTTNPDTGENAIRYINGKINWYSNLTGESIETTNAFTDIRWIHVAFNYDSTNAAESDRIRIYVDGERQSLSGTYPSLNAEPRINDTNVHTIGGSGGYIERELNGYLSDVYFVDGWALEPTEFGALFPQDPSAADRRWGPLDSSVVTANINDYEPTPDAVPNYDQKWSDNLVNSWNYSAGSSAEQAFDGDDSTSATILNNNLNQSLTFTPDTPIPCSKVQFKLSPQGDGNTYYRINGGDPAPAGGGKTITGITELVSLEINQGNQSNSVGIRWIKVDDRLLIDGPADNSQVWSEHTDIPLSPGNSVTNNPADLFDGNESTRVRSPFPDAVGNKFINLNLDSPLAVTTGITVKLGGLRSTQKVILNEGLASEASASRANDSVEEIVVPFSGDLVTLTIETLTTDGSQYGVNTIKADGKYLIDAPAQWNTSQVWSDGGTGSLDPNTPSFGNAFNGIINTVGNAQQFDDVIYPNVGSSATINFTNVGLVNKLRLFLNGGSNSGKCPVFVNGTEVLTGVTGFPYAGDWYEIPGVSSLNSITLDRTSSEKVTGLFAVEVNGEILVDGGSFGANGFYLPFNPDAAIGTDSSGQDNHFQDENFAAGNTDEVWSSYLSGNIATSSGPSTGINGFNGSYRYGSTSTRATDDTNALVFDVPASIQGKQMYAYMNSAIGGASPGWLYKKNDDAWVDVIDNNLGEYESSSSATNVFLVDLGTDTTKLSFKTTGAITGGFRAIVVDGEYLVDKNIQDTVTDTPLRNYAVLLNTNSNSITNGNLEFVGSGAAYNAGTSVSGNPGKYYAELRVLSGVDASSNFVSLGFSRSSSTAPNDATAFDGIQVLVYDGHLSVSEDNASSETQRITDAEAGNGSLIGLTLDASTDTPSGQIFINGRNVGSFNLTAGAYSEVYGMTRGNVAKGGFNFGQQPFAASNVTYDQKAGTVMLDVTPSSDPTIDDSQVWSKSLSTPSGTFSQPPILTFNANNNDYAVSGQNQETITFAPLVDIDITSFEVYATNSRKQTGKSTALQ